MKARESEKERLINELISICWWMRGSVQYETAKQMSYIERKAILDFINKRMEKIKQQKLQSYAVY